MARVASRAALNREVEDAMDLEIAELQERDLAAGFLESLATLADVGLTPEEATGLLHDRARQGIKTYVARLNGRVVGTASLLVERKFIHRGGKVGHIEDVAVDRDVQLRGIGTRLVAHATGEARKLGCYKVILDCFERLTPFYARLGYRVFNIGMRNDL
jgi:glucosamine-phosphate N-acetyltransferase